MYETLVAALRNVSEYDTGYAKLIWDAADAIEEMSRLHEAQRQNLITLMNEEPEPKWIPVTERLPEYDSVVLVTDGEDVGTGYRYVLGEIGFTGWAVPFADIEEDDVSHWMPIPEPPKEDAE